MGEDGVMLFQYNACVGSRKQAKLVQKQLQNFNTTLVSVLVKCATLP